MTSVDMFVIGGAFLFGVVTGGFMFIVLRYLINIDEFKPEDPIEIRRRHREAFLKQQREMRGE